MPNYRAPSKKSLLADFHALSPESADLIRAIIHGAIKPENAVAQTARWISYCEHRPRWLERAMHAIDILLENHGVEVDTVQTTRANVERLIYSNSGDSYAPTICYWRGQFRLTTWGDIVERYAPYGVDR